MNQDHYVSETLWLNRRNHRHRVIMFHPVSGEVKDSVLYLHGTGNDGCFLIYDLVAYLTQRNLRVVAVDIEGHGCLSDGEWSGQVTAFFDDLMDFLGDLGIDKVHLVGHSLGGVMGLCVFFQQTISSLSEKKSSSLGVSHPYLSLSCLAVISKVRWLGFYKELALVFQRNYWRYLWCQGIARSVPSLGFLRRKEFPIRLSGGSHISSYPAVFAGWIVSQQVESKCSQLLAHSTNLATSFLWLEARWDGLGHSFNPEMKQSFERLGCYKSLATTHLGILLEPEAHQSIYQLILTASQA